MYLLCSPSTDRQYKYNIDPMTLLIGQPIFTAISNQNKSARSRGVSLYYFKVKW